MFLMPQTMCRPKVCKLFSILLLAFTMLFCTARHVLAQAQTRQGPVGSLRYDLKNPDPVRRKEAAMLLGNNKVQRATPDLVVAAGDADPAVRREIVIALDTMQDIRALPTFVSLSSDPERDIRDKCIAEIKNKEVSVREGLAEVFGLIGDSKAVAPLRELSQVRRGQVAAVANQALRRINARTASQ